MKKSWEYWAEFFQRWQINNLVATFLEAVGPLKLLWVQLIYIGQPFLNQVFPEDHLNNLAFTLEDQKKSHSFIRYIRSETED